MNIRSKIAAGVLAAGIVAASAGSASAYTTSENNFLRYVGTYSPYSSDFVIKGGRSWCSYKASAGAAVATQQIYMRYFYGKPTSFSSRVGAAADTYFC